MTHEAIARRTNVPLEIVRRAFGELEKPDPRSRNPDHEGRRIKGLDEHRDWGWVIVNYVKYREIRTQADKAEAHGYGSSRSGYVYYVADDGDQPKKIKIAFSTNPWARMPELRSNHPKAKILVIEKTSGSVLSVRHEQFRNLRGESVWFGFDGQLKQHIESLVPEPVRRYGRREVRSYDSDRSSMQRQKQKNKEEREKELLEIPPMNRKEFDALAQMRGVPEDCAEWFWKYSRCPQLDGCHGPASPESGAAFAEYAGELAFSTSALSAGAIRISSFRQNSGAELVLRQKEYERVIEAIAAFVATPPPMQWERCFTPKGKNNN